MHEYSQMHLKAPEVMEVHSGWWDLTYRIVTLWCSWALCSGLWETLRAAETSAQLCGRLCALFSQQRFLGFHNHKVFQVSDSSLLQSQHLLHHIMACILYQSLSLYIHIVSLGADGTGVWSEKHLEMPIERTWRCTWGLWSCKLGDELGGCIQVSLEMHLEAEIKLNQEMHLEAVIEQVCRCPWRPWSSKFGDAFGGRDIVPQRCTWRQ